MEAKNLFFDVLRDQVKKDGFFNGFVFAAVVCLAAAMVIMFTKPEILERVVSPDLYSQNARLSEKVEHLQKQEEKLQESFATAQTRLESLQSKANEWQVAAESWKFKAESWEAQAREYKETAALFIDISKEKGAKLLEAEEELAEIKGGMALR